MLFDVFGKGNVPCMERCRCFDCKNSGEVYHPDYKFHLDVEISIPSAKSDGQTESPEHYTDGTIASPLVSGIKLGSPKASLLDLASMCESRPEL